MEIVVAVRSWPVGPLAGAVSAIATSTPSVAHVRADAELALRSRARDLLVFDPEVVDIAAAAAWQVNGAPRLVAWLRAPSPARTAALLDSGADEVVDGAMPAVELAARLRRVARMSAGPLVARPASFDALSVDARQRTASWQDRPLPLAPREIEVLQVLVAGAGLTVSREVVYRQVWRWAMPRGDRTVDVNVKRIRSKLAGAEVPIEIIAEPGVGYRLSVTNPAVTSR